MNRVLGELLFTRQLACGKGLGNAAAIRKNQALRRRDEVYQTSPLGCSHLTIDECDCGCNRDRTPPAFAADRVHSRKTCDRDTRGAAGVLWPVVLGEHAAHDIFIDIEAEGMRDLLRNANTAELEIAALHLDERRDKFRGWPLWTGLTSTAYGREEKTVLSIEQGLVEY